MPRKIKTLFWIFAIVFAVSVSAIADEKEVVKEEKDTHKVAKGDTLWDISKKYRNDPFQWAKIWKLNPYITNPHLIFPGQVILLEERIYVKTPEAAVKEVEPAAVQKIPTYFYPQAVSAGFILKDKPSIYSIIVASHREQINYFKGNNVFLDKKGSLPLKEGVSYLVVDTSKVVVHPETNEEVGYLYHVKGILRVGAIHKDTAEATITESFDLITIGDTVIPFKAFSDQIVLKNNDKKIKSIIVEGKFGKRIFGQNQIVYLDKGLKDGVEVGNRLKVIKQVEKVDSSFIRGEEGETHFIPVDPFAEVLIIVSENDFSTALITDSKKDVQIGYTVTNY